jgi:hypothetical protein
VKSEFWDVSPAMGLLLSSSPSLIPNLRHVPSATKGLVGELYYQRSHGGKRYGPIAIANSKSLPITWLSVEQIGHMVGLAAAQSRRGRPFDSVYLDNQLKKKEIHCNFVHDQWTGISFARYRKLIGQIAANMDQQQRFRADGGYVPPSYGLLTLMQCVWERAANKEDLLRYFQALERASEVSVFRDDYDHSDDFAHWLNERFSAGEVDSALERSWTIATQQFTSRDAVDVGRALETIAASLSVQAAFKGAIRQGRYSYSVNVRPRDGSDTASPNSPVSIPTRPDCVEVVVREIVDNMLFGTSTTNHQLAKCIDDSA